ncbi:MAG: carbohydrate kinase [Planctomycetota bacterium]|nr:carbohydrate kinase [Planctomycetota bacterium]
MSKKPVAISLGEVLWDVLPDGKTLGGAPSNVGRHLAQLGCEAHIVSAVGDDDLGREAIAYLRDKGLNVENVAILAGAPTSTVDATLDPAGNATYVIHEDVAWDRLPVTGAILALAGRAEAINFGSLALRSPAGRRAGFAVLDATPAAAVRMFDLNLRQPFIFPEILREGLARATVVKMNDDELGMMTGMFGLAKRPERAIEDLLAAYPNLRHLVVTRGAEGAWWHDRRALLKRGPAASPRVVDTIGAGDSFTAVGMCGLLRGMEVKEVLRAALIVAAYVCSRRGGMPELPAELKRLVMVDF